jgi:hypothetical protein
MSSVLVSTAGFGVLNGWHERLFRTWDLAHNLAAFTIVAFFFCIWLTLWCWCRWCSLWLCWVHLFCSNSEESWLWSCLLLICYLSAIAAVLYLVLMLPHTVLEGFALLCIYMLMVGHPFSSNMSFLLAR